jgi:hypothetical protein
MAMNRRVSNIIAFLAALAPMLAVWIEKVILVPRPLATAYADPEVYFFYDSLRLFLGSAPQNVDHPGTPVQILGALVLRFTGPTPLAMDTWRPVMYSIALLLNAAAVIILLQTLLREVPRPAAVAAIWTFWICPAAMRHVAIWSPETVYFFVTVLAIAAFHAYFIRSGAARAAWLGAAIGLCVAVKFVFLSWAIAAAIVVAILGSKRVRDTALMLGATFGTFLLATLPAITRYDAMFRWITALVSRDDWYGRSHPASGSAIADLVTAVMQAKAWHLWIAISFLMLLVVMKRGDTAMRAAFLFGTIAVALNYVMAAKGIVPKEVDFFGDIRYRYVLPAGSGVSARDRGGVPVTAIRADPARASRSPHQRHARHEKRGGRGTHAPPARGRKPVQPHSHRDARPFADEAGRDRHLRRRGARVVRVACPFLRRAALPPHGRAALSARRAYVR